MKLLKKLFVVFLLLAVVFSLTVPGPHVAVVFGEGNPAGSLSSGNECQRIEPSFLKKIESEQEKVTVIVELSTPCVAEAKDRNVILRLLRPISEESLGREQEAFLEKLKNAGINFEPGYSFQNAFNGVSIRIKGTDIDRLLEFKEVKHIYENRKFKAELYNAVEVTEARNVWELLDLNNVGITGKGIVVGIIDTGIDYNHPDLGGGFGPNYKVIGGYDFVNNDPDPMDDNSHGTHVAGIVAANGRLKGIAPDAKLMAYKVLSKDGRGTTEWILAGLDRALKDKCDVVNLSLGYTNIWFDQDSPEVKAANNLVNSGIIVVNAAGNSGTRTNYLDFPISGVGIGTDVISVAASSIDTLYKMKYKISLKTDLGLLRSINAQAANFPLQKQKIFPENTEYEVVDCGLGREEDFSNKDLTNKIALIERGEIYFSEKVYNAQKAKAAGVIIYNNEEGVIQPLFAVDYDKIPDDPSKSFIPCAFISKNDGEYIKSVMDKGLKVSFKYEKEPFGENITDFSSQGPALSRDNKPMFKPDIAAPGYDIYSTVPGKKYDSYPGTSMASPMVAGAVALLKQAHPDWTTKDFKDALMNTADILWNPTDANNKEYGAIPETQPVSFTYQGAGRINILNAVKAPALIHPGGFAFQQVYSTESFDFNIKNVSKNKETFSVEGKMLSLNSLNGVKFEFSENPISVNPGETKKFSVTLKFDSSLPQGQHEGAIFLKDDNGFVLHIPFYFFSPVIPYPKVFSNFQLSSASFSPNGDGVNDNLRINFVIGKGTEEYYYNYTSPYKTFNYLYDFKMEVLDSNGKSLGEIFNGSLLPAYYEFNWDGKTENGRNFLTNGTYKLRATYLKSIRYKEWDSSTNSWKTEESYATEDIQFSITDTPNLINTKPVHIYINSSKCVKSGGLIAVPVYLENAVDVKKINFSLQYDPKFLSVKDVLNDGFFSQNWNDTQIKFDKENDKGVLDVDIEAEQGQQKSGEGSLCTIIFDVNSTGITNLSFDKVHVFNSVDQELNSVFDKFDLNIIPPDAKSSIVLDGEEKVYTNSTNYILSGTSVLIDYILVNGTKVIPDVSGKFTATVSLKEGENQIKIEGIGCIGYSVSLTRTVVLDTIPPDLYISSPQSGSISENNYLIISGKVTDSGTGIQSLTINGNTVSISSDGSFSLSVNLTEGTNNFTITAEDKVGNKTTKTLTVIYKKPVQIITLILQIGSSTFTVNGETKTLDSSPIIKNGRTLVPIRAIVEAMGGSVSWDGTEKKVTITLKDIVIELWINKPQAEVNGELKWIDDTNHKVVPEIINGRTMLPLRFVAETLGANVDWDGTTKTITITYKP